VVPGKTPGESFGAKKRMRVKWGKAGGLAGLKGGKAKGVRPREGKVGKNQRKLDGVLHHQEG